MFGLTGKIKMAVIAIGGIAVVTAIGAAYWHYTSLLEDNAVLRENNTKLEFAVEQQGVTIDEQSNAIDEWQASQDRLLSVLEGMQEAQQSATSETRRLNDAFSKRDLGALANQKPGLIERRINDGTARALRLLECASGAEGSDCPGRN